jgi:small GTP-binding protein
VDRETAEALEEAEETGVLKLERLVSVPREVRGLTGLRELRLVDGEFELPYWLPALTSLRVLDLHDSVVPSLDPLMGMESLRALGLSGLSGALRERAVRTLTGLEALVAPDTDTRAVPPWIARLTNLRLLDLGGNPLGHIAPGIELPALDALFLWGHEFSRVPDALRALSRLRVLDLSRGGSHDRPRNEEPSIGEFNLWRLVGRGTRRRGITSPFQELPDWVAGLPLEWLSVAGLGLPTLPELPPTLWCLYARRNAFTEVPPSVTRLPRLARLDLSRNAIRDIDPPTLDRLRHLSLLDLSGNPLGVPPEVLADETTTPRTLADYLTRVKTTGRPLNEAKLLVVGEGSVGKTSLIRRLVRGDFAPYESKTEGIAVTRWPIQTSGDPVTLNVWDFGGQEIMHATHQFFLTRRSVYVLVLDTRQGEEQNRVEYWLKLVNGFSDSSPVIVVGNKTDEGVLDIDVRGLRAKYPNVVAVLPVSCRSGAGVEEVRQRVAQTVDALPHVRDALPHGFFAVKDELAALDVNYLGYDEYTGICARHDVLEPPAQEQLVGFLHDLGSVLCFRDDPRLSDTNILNPTWVTGGVYRLLNSNLAAQRKGLLRWADVDAILDDPDYPPQRRQFIVDVMKRFELCYEADGTFLVPDLLTKEEPDTGSWDDALHFEIAYDILPTSVISRLIVRMRSLISRETVWRTGFVARMDRSRALIRGDREDAVVTVDVTGPPEGRRGILTMIRGELRAITATIPGLTCQERVPVPGYPGVWVPYDHLLNLEAAGRRTVVPQGLTIEFPVRELLAGVDEPVPVPVGQAQVEPAPQPAPPPPVDGTPWQPREAMWLGVLLLGGLLLLAVAVRLLKLGPAIIAVALPAVVVLAFVVLRVTGRVSEGALTDIVKGVLTRKDGESP